MTPKTRLNLIRALVLVGVIGITVLLFIYRLQLHKLEAYGYPGIFLVSILANASIILPLPGVMLTSAMGAVFNPFWVAVAAGSGAALGELTGYMTGFSGQAVIEENKWYPRFSAWMKKYGAITVLVLAFIPNPAFDMAGMIAGALRMPLWKFLGACIVGKILKMMLFAYGGAMLFGYFSRFY